MSLVLFKARFAETTIRGIAPVQCECSRKGRAFSHITAAQPLKPWAKFSPLAALRLLMVCLWQFCLLVGLLGSSEVLGQTASATAPQLGQISGRVLDDSGQPLAAAVVRLRFAGVTMRGSQPNATTDGEGRFVFNNLGPGNYRLLISERALVLPESIGAQPTYRIGDQVTLNLVKGAIITGRVTSSAGEPLVGIEVQATRVRDGNGQAALFIASRLTDDRGIYRIYGLPPGVYLVNTNKHTANYYEATAFDGEAPTYYPAATRDTATEITLSQSEEAGGIDIRHRGEFGRVVSGRLTGAIASAGSGQGMTVYLRLPGTQQVIATTYVYADAARNAFIFVGVLDGEYELIARRTDGDDGGAASVPRKITVKGADVTDIELSLAPLASLSGKLALEPFSPNETIKCAPARAWQATEVLLNAPRLDKAELATPEAAPNDKREFRLTGLDAGRYALAAQLPSPAWYLKNIMQEAAAKRSPVRAGIALNAGQAATGFIVTLAEGAASVRGRVTGGKMMRVHLIPTEDTAADDVWRYAELTLRHETNFQFAHLAPGKYWLLAQAASATPSTAPLAYDATQRAKLRQAAVRSGKELTLTPCQQMADIQLTVSAP
jgi:hypothetical protein